MNLTAIIAAAIGSSALFTFFQFLIGRNDGKNEQLNSIKEEIDAIKQHIADLDEKNERQDARTSRSRILRFDDELIEGKIHSREYFLQILDDCEIYEAWTKKNPNVKNGYAKQAVMHIRKVYNDLIDKGAWKHE